MGHFSSQLSMKPKFNKPGFSGDLNWLRICLSWNLSN